MIYFLGSIDVVSEVSGSVDSGFEESGNDYIELE